MGDFLFSSDYILNEESTINIITYINYNAAVITSKRESISHHKNF